MERINRTTGLQITIPAGYGVAETAAPASSKKRFKPGLAFGAVPLPQDPVAAAAASDAVVAAFCNQEMQLVDQVELEPAPAAAQATRRRGAKPAAADDTSEFALAIAPHEDAVVLLEQDGVYSWQYASEATSVATGPKRRGVRTEPTQRLVKFRIKLPAEEAPKSRPARRGIIGDFVRDKIRAFVFKFAARVAVGSAMRFLERNVRHGLVGMTDADPARWALITDPAALPPKDRPARILLFVHGTFSSTIGAYGALTATPWGQEFLRAARDNYDAVIGFDHATLSDDPLANASDLLARLQNIAWPHPPRFDVVTHSRGGLVLRSLTEHLLPLASFRARFERVIFVAVTNGGTRLAEPDNWQTFIDLYTNLSVAACRLIAMMPQAKGVTLVLSEIVQGLGAFVKYCATTAVTERGVPGLAAMEPDGDFIKKLNEEQANQPTIANSYYCAVTSEFVPQVLGGDHEPKELSLRLVQWIADVFARQLMKEANDLVVDTASMTRVDPQLGKYIKDSLDFGKNPQVYHTNYFVRPEVINALARWLRLAKPAEAGLRAKPSGSATRHGKPGAPKKRGVSDLPGRVAFQSDVIATGGVVGAEVPAAVDTDILVMSATTPLGEALESIKGTSPSYVVLRRDDRGEMLNYAFATEELIARGSGKGVEDSLLNALDLHETDRSGTRSITDTTVPKAPTRGTVTTRSAVVLDGHKVVGVLPEKSELADADGLVKLAKTAAAPKKDSDRIQARRTMPTFTVPATSTPMTAPKASPTRGLPKAPARTTRKSAPKASPTRGLGGSPESLPRAARKAAPKARPSGRTAGKRSTSEKAAVEPKVTCHFRAEMDEEVVFKHLTTVEVLVSREVIGQLVDAAAAEGKAEIDPSRKLLIQVLPKVNFQSVDEGWTEIDPPQPDKPQSLYFDLRATHEGEGEVWVVARQGQVPLATLVLKPRIVKTKSQAARRALATATTAEAPKLSAPLHQLIIQERRDGNDIFYHYQLESPTLRLLKWGDSKPLVGNRQEYVEDKYKRIEERWLSNQQDKNDFFEELRAIGAEMFDELIPPDLQRVLWDYRDKIESIMVIAEEPFIPWELVHLCEPGKPLSSETRFLGQMGLVRWLHEAGWPDELLSIRPGKARYVIPDYPDPRYELPEAKQEPLFLQTKFGATAVDPKSGTVRRLLAQPGAFDLLHFACHGVAEQDNISNAQLLMQGRIEGSQYVLDPLSASTVEAHANLKSDGRAPMIVLNACQAGRAGYKLTGVGGFAQAFLRRGAGAFIGTLWSVGDSPARYFTEEFYTQLIKGATVAEAAIKAREKARTAGDATWLAYVVYGHPHAKLSRK